MIGVITIATLLSKNERNGNALFEGELLRHRGINTAPRIKI